MPPSTKQHPERKLVRAAQSIRDQIRYVARKRAMSLAQQLSYLTGALHRLESVRRKINIALTRGWDAATNRLCRQIPDTLRDIAYYLDTCKREAEACHVGVPTLRTMLDDLHQLEAEFGGLQHRPECRGLAVFTDDIQLEDVWLGPFEIQLDPSDLGRDAGHGAFRIIAQDPHPAESNSCVTHPHVSDERICAGDAAAPIRSALASGRICDAFMLIRSVLTNYNPSSPYVSLDDWFGRPCHDCGYICTSDYSSICEACENRICDECASYCRVCSETYCVGCLDTCGVCDERVCSSCMTKCPDCGEELCTNCLEDGECPCHESKEEDDQDKNEESNDHDIREQTHQPQREGQGASPAVEAPGPNVEAA